MANLAALLGSIAVVTGCGTALVGGFVSIDCGKPKAESRKRKVESGKPKANAPSAFRSPLSAFRYWTTHERP